MAYLVGFGGLKDRRTQYPEVAGQAGSSVERNCIPSTTLLISDDDGGGVTVQFEFVDILFLLSSDQLVHISLSLSSDQFVGISLPSDILCEFVGPSFNDVGDLTNLLTLRFRLSCLAG